MDKLTWVYGYGSLATSYEKSYDSREFHREKMLTLLQLINQYYVFEKEKPLILNCGEYAYVIMKEALLAAGYIIKDSNKWSMHVVPSFEHNIIQFYNYELIIATGYGIPFIFYTPFENNALSKIANVIYEETCKGNFDVTLDLCKLLIEMITKREKTNE